MKGRKRVRAGGVVVVVAVSRLGLVLHGEIEFEFCRQLVFGVKTIGEIHASNPTVGVDLSRGHRKGEGKNQIKHGVNH